MELDGLLPLHGQIIAVVTANAVDKVDSIPVSIDYRGGAFQLKSLRNCQHTTCSDWMFVASSRRG